MHRRDGTRRWCSTSDSTTHDQAERILLDLIGFAVVSARNLLDETPDYGPIRLLELADRLLRSAAGFGIQTGPWADDLRAQLRSAGRALTDGPETFRTLLDNLVSCVLNHRVRGAN